MLSTFGDPTKDRKQTNHALAWLEVVGNVPPSFKERYRYTTFAIREVVMAGEHRVDKWPSTKTADEEVRRGAVIVKGDFGVHGKAAEKEVPMDVALAFKPGETVPTRLEMHSTKPMTVTLAQHAIVPTDVPGLVAKGLLGKRVAETVEISIAFVAAPAPKPMPASQDGDRRDE